MTTCGDRRCAIPAHQRGAYRMHAFRIEDAGPPRFRELVRAALSWDAVVFVALCIAVLAMSVVWR